MTTALELGSISKVNIREVWPTEPGHFTPWLGKNLDKLGVELGLELELVDTEAPVGSYSLDILARDLGSGRAVVIENQYGNTDHDHLGKLLTYASGYDAYAVVWVSERFRDEHREALDMLNNRTGEDTQFFGVEVEVLQIDNSRPSVTFKLVAIPRKWRNPKQRSRGSGGVRHNERYRQFYQGLVERLNSEASGFADLPIKEIGTEHFCKLAPAAKNVRYSASFGSFYGYKNTTWVQLIIKSDNRGWDKNVFNQLQVQKEEIEKELGTSLVWKPEHSGQSGIMIPREGSIDASPETLREVQGWMVERLLKFKEVFGPRLAELVE